MTKPPYNKKQIVEMLSASATLNSTYVAWAYSKAGNNEGSHKINCENLLSAIESYEKKVPLELRKKVGDFDSDELSELKESLEAILNPRRNKA
ncbi:hypothetical protein KY348_07390 [Candidatus Woesearchaeota archaeon]|nr:hypothetical protein [Candidatus Woesearchaeota archaeon]